MDQQINTLSIKKMITLLMRKWVIILAVTLICGILALVVSCFFVTPKYTAVVSIIVDNRSTLDQENPEGSGSQIKSTSDITASRMLTDTYIAIFKNTSFLERVAAKVNETSYAVTSGSVEPLSARKIGDMLKMSSVNATEVLQIKASSVDPQLSVDVCYAIVETAEVVLRETMNTLTVNSVEGDNILVPDIPSSPNVKINILLFSFLGLFICCIGIIAYNLLDDTVKVTDDVSEICGYPVIGEIPSIKNDTPYRTRRA